MSTAPDSRAAEQPPARGTWAVAWEIDVDPDDAADAYEAALRVWRETFRRTGKPGPEEACVFTVTDPGGRSWAVDLSLPQDEVSAVAPRIHVPAGIDTLVVQLPSGAESFALQGEVLGEVSGTTLRIRTTKS